VKNNIVKSNLAKPVFYLFLVVCFLFVRIESGDAHRVNLFAWVEGDTVHVESKFSGGKKVDENGEFSFKVPEKTDLKIILIAGRGHRAEWTIAASETQVPASGKKPVAEEGTTLKGIIIGIGFIFGLTGIVAYIRKRKKNILTL
jgi:hypothetical protein